MKKYIPEDWIQSIENGHVVQGSSRTITSASRNRQEAAAIEVCPIPGFDKQFVLSDALKIDSTHLCKEYLKVSQSYEDRRLETLRKAGKEDEKRLATGFLSGLGSPSTGFVGQLATRLPAFEKGENAEDSQHANVSHMGNIKVPRTSLTRAIIVVTDPEAPVPEGGALPLVWCCASCGTIGWFDKRHRNTSMVGDGRRFRDDEERAAQCVFASHQLGKQRADRIVCRLCAKEQDHWWESYRIPDGSVGRLDSGTIHVCELGDAVRGYRDPDDESFARLRLPAEEHGVCMTARWSHEDWTNYHRFLRLPGMRNLCEWLGITPAPAVQDHNQPPAKFWGYVQHHAIWRVRSDSVYRLATAPLKFNGFETSAQRLERWRAEATASEEKKQKEAAKKARKKANQASATAAREEAKDEDEWMDDQEAHTDPVESGAGSPRGAVRPADTDPVLAAQPCDDGSPAPKQRKQGDDQYDLPNAMIRGSDEALGLLAASSAYQAAIRSAAEALQQGQWVLAGAGRSDRLSAVTAVAPPGADLESEAWKDHRPWLENQIADTLLSAPWASPYHPTMRQDVMRALATHRPDLITSERDAPVGTVELESEDDAGLEVKTASPVRPEHSGPEPAHLAGPVPVSEAGDIAAAEGEAPTDPVMPGPIAPPASKAPMPVAPSPASKAPMPVSLRPKPPPPQQAPPPKPVTPVGSGAGSPSPATPRSDPAQRPRLAWISGREDYAEFECFRQDEACPKGIRCAQGFRTPEEYKAQRKRLAPYPARESLSSLNMGILAYGHQDSLDERVVGGRDGLEWSLLHHPCALMRCTRTTGWKRWFCTSCSDEHGDDQLGKVCPEAAREAIKKAKKEKKQPPFPDSWVHEARPFKTQIALAFSKEYWDSENGAWPWAPSADVAARDLGYEPSQMKDFQKKYPPALTWGKPEMVGFIPGPATKARLHAQTWKDARQPGNVQHLGFDERGRPPLNSAEAWAQSAAQQADAYAQQRGPHESPRQFAGRGWTTHGKGGGRK